MKHANLHRWQALWHDLGAIGDSAPIYRRLSSAYAEPHRFYHTRLHIEECLAEFDATRDLALQPLEIETAIWFHDISYDPSSPTNEDESADLAIHAFREAGLATAFTTRIGELIRTTAKHEAEPNTDAALLVDIDLAIFGQSPERFETYEQAIREEYFWVNREIYRTRRAEILARFLARPFVYSTDLFRLKYEAAARANLTRSVERLESASA